METIEGDIYDYPGYYDLVFCSDWKAEYDFLCGVFDRHVKGKAAKRIFEPACGTGRLLYRFADAGYEASGLDLNEKSVAFCNERLARRGHPESVFVGDMTDFQLRRKADGSFNMINSFRHLPTEKLAAAHLRCMAGALRKGGVYVLGLHLTPTAVEPSDEESWTARRGHLCVNTHMYTTHRDLKNRVERFSMSYYVHTPKRSFRLADEIEFRTYTTAQFRSLLKKVPELEICEIYDFSYDLDEPIELYPETEDAVFVLRKR